MFVIQCQISLQNKESLMIHSDRKKKEIKEKNLTKNERVKEMKWILKEIKVKQKK